MNSTSAPIAGSGSSTEATRARHGAAGVVAQYIQDLAHPPAAH